MTAFQVQDLGDGEGLDVLDADGDLLLSGVGEREVATFLEDNGDPSDTVVVLQGALGRLADDEEVLEVLVSELREES